jgi:hypothetical protein
LRIIKPSKKISDLPPIIVPPPELEEQIKEWVEYYNNHRYHEAIDNVTPSDKYFGRDQEILEHRKKTKTETMKRRRRLNQTMGLMEAIS